MNRRLYFKFPSKAEAQAAVEELSMRESVAIANMHAPAKQGVDLVGLPDATRRQRRDLPARLAWWLWEGDLLVFFVVLLGLIIALNFGFMLWAGVAILVMAVTFIGGAFYAMFIPEVSLTEFCDTLAHGEVLLMVDVPQNKVTAIERCIGQHHHSGVAGGSSWTINMFGI